jgi:uncharacterized protein (DUF2267 family)
LDERCSARLQFERAAKLGAEPPLLARGVYFDRYRLTAEPDRTRSLKEFSQHFSEELKSIRPVDPGTRHARCFRVLTRHIDFGQSTKVRDSLPKEIQALFRRSGLKAPA